MDTIVSNLLKQFAVTNAPSSPPSHFLDTLNIAVFNPITITIFYFLFLRKSALIIAANEESLVLFHVLCGLNTPFHLFFNDNI